MKFNIPASWYDAVDGLDEGITVSAGNVGRTVTLPEPTQDQIEYLETVKASADYDPKTIFARLRAMLRPPSNRF
jgi:hypothetical protein